MRSATDAVFAVQANVERGPSVLFSRQASGA
jgi:hypothetical protein